MPLVGVERDPATRQLAVVSRQASGIRLHELLRGAHDREIVPDMGASLYVAAQVLTATHAFHSLSGLPHGTLNPHHLVMSPDGELQITDYAFAEVIENAKFSRERLWRELHIAAWMGSDAFSFQADVRHAALIAMAFMVGRPLESDDLTTAIDSLLAEVEEAAMIRGGRLFADPVGAWLVRALGAGSSEGYADAGAAADACAALLTERERSEAARALPQLIEAILEPLPETVRPQPAIEAEPEARYEPVITESAIEPPAITETVTETPSTFASWPESSYGETKTPGFEHPSDERITTELVDEPMATPEHTAPFSEVSEPVVEPVPEQPHEEPVQAAEEAPAIEEEAEEPGRRGKKRRKRRGKRGATAEPPAAPQPPAAVPPPIAAGPLQSPEPIPHTPWVPASTTNAPTVEQPSGVSSASPFSILNRPAAAPAASPQPPANPPTAVPIETGSSQYFPPSVIDTNISQPQGQPASQTPSLLEPPQVIRLKSAANQPAPAQPIRLKSQSDEPGGIRVKEPPAPARARTTPAVETFDLPAEPVEGERRIPRGLWKYAAAVLVVLVVGVAAVTMKFTAGAKDVKPGTLVIETTPAGSQISVDGEAKGVTPATFELPPGRHELKLTRKNSSHSWTVEIASGARRVERLDWSALFSTGGVEVVSNNPGAKVFVDGKPRGEVPVTITDLTPGRHVILAQSPSGNVRRTVNIVAGETTRLDLAIYSGWLVVGSPIELEVVENGKVIGQAGQGPLVLPAGRHRIELVNGTYSYRSSHEVEIRPGEEERIVENPAGVLNVNATPWAEVWVDGTRAGETPIANVKVPLGTREILFKHPQYGERRMTVTVTAKEPVQLAIDMTKPQ